MTTTSWTAPMLGKFRGHIFITRLLSSLEERPRKSHKSPKNLATAPLNLDHPILSLLSKCQTITHFNQVHCLMVTTGMYREVFAASRLLIAASFSLTPANIPLAYVLFSQIQSPDVYSFNIMIKFSSKTLNPLDSLHFYQELLHRGLYPNDYTFCFVLTSCAQALALHEGKQIHAHFIKHLSMASVHAATSLAGMYGKCGDIRRALQTFDEMPQRSEASWGVVIGAHIDHGFPMDALQLFAKLRSLGFAASNAVLVGAFCACGKLQDLESGRMIHGQVEAMGLELNVTLGTSLVDMYSKCGAIEMAMEVFSRMPAKSVASWNCMIAGLAVNGGGDTAIGLFKDLQASGLTPNSATFVGVLHACSHGGLVNEALKYFTCMRELYGIEPSIKHYGCMVDMYCRVGKLEKAIEVIRAMPLKPDIVIWGALLGGCKKHGNAKLGEQVGAQIMKLQPHKVSGCSGLSDMYAMDGRWEDVINVRTMMLDVDIGREPGSSTLT